MRVKLNVKVANNMGALVRGIPQLADKTARQGRWRCWRKPGVNARWIRASYATATR